LNLQVNNFIKDTEFFKGGMINEKENEEDGADAN
jgi:hypothetical protein